MRVNFLYNISTDFLLYIHTLHTCVVFNFILQMVFLIHAFFNFHVKGKKTEENIWKGYRLHTLSIYLNKRLEIVKKRA